MITRSRDEGKIWDPKQVFWRRCDDSRVFNCPRISRLPDGSMAVICDAIAGQDEETRDVCQYVWKSKDGGKTWNEPDILPFQGIVPDQYQVLSNGRHIFGIHRRGKSGMLEQYAYYSDDEGKTWTETLVAADTRYHLCEVSIVEIEKGTLVAFMRENSGMGYCCKKAISHDFGTTWEGVYDTNIDACHRPVVQFYDEGKLMMTYRFMQGGKGWAGHWTQNLFAAFFDTESALAQERKQQSARIFPVAFDRSPLSDTGYSGWVKLKDGSFYVVNYLLDDAPKAQIRGYHFALSDVFANI